MKTIIEYIKENNNMKLPDIMSIFGDKEHEKILQAIFNYFSFDELKDFLIEIYNNNNLFDEPCYDEVIDTRIVNTPNKLYDYFESLEEYGISFDTIIETLIVYFPKTEVDKFTKFLINELGIDNE